MRLREGRRGIGRTVAAVAVIVIIVAAGGLGYYYYSTTSSSHQIIIGMPLPLNSPIGQNMLDSAKMAVNQINGEGGVTLNGTSYTFSIVSYDTQEADPSIPVSNGLSGMNALITQDHVNFLIGGYRSDVVLAELPTAAQNHIIYIALGADPGIAGYVANDYSTNKYIFQGFTNSTQQNEQYGPLPVYMLAAYKEGLYPVNITNIAVLGEQAAWTQAVIGSATASNPQGSPLYGALKGVGFGVTYINYFPLSPPGGSYDSMFSQLASSGTQLIYILAAGTETPLLIKDWSSFNWAADSATGGKKPIMIGADVLSEFAGNTAKGGYNYYNETSGGSSGQFTFGWGPFVQMPTPISATSNAFYNNFTSTYNFNPIFEDGFVYSAVYYLKNAIQHAQSLNSGKVIPFLEQTDYTGPMGVIQFTRDHGLNIALTPVPSIPAVAAQWHNDGKLYYVWSSTNPLTFVNVQLPNGTVISSFTVKL